MSLPIVELFPALQGEGLRMGHPSIFVRTALCTLTCAGFGCEMTSPKGNVIKGCDSIMAVNPEFKSEWEYYASHKNLINDIEYAIIKSSEADKYGQKPDIIFTGGEPLIHYKNPVMLHTVEFFVSRGYNVWFETNGTMEVDFSTYPIMKQVNFSISVKMGNSGEAIEKRWKPEVVNSYLINTKESYFKFVHNGMNTGLEIFEFLSLIPTYAPVYIMPLGATKEELEANAVAAYEYAFIHNFRYSDRIHIRMYDTKRMV